MQGFQGPPLDSHWQWMVHHPAQLEDVHHPDQKNVFVSLHWFTKQVRPPRSMGQIAPRWAGYWQPEAGWRSKHIIPYNMFPTFSGTLLRARKPMMICFRTLTFSLLPCFSHMLCTIICSDLCWIFEPAKQNTPWFRSPIGENNQMAHQLSQSAPFGASPILG